MTVTEAVLQSLTLSPPNASFPRGLDLDFSASGHFSDGQDRDLSDQVVWTSLDENVASISNSPGSIGRAHAKNLGDTTISASLGAVSQSTRLTVTAAVLQSIDIAFVTPSLPAGLERVLTATGQFSDGTSEDLSDQVVWESTRIAVAVIDQSGRVTAKMVGTTTISARKGAIAGTASLEVSDAVLETLSIAPENSQLPLGLTRNFTASGHYSDGSDRDLTDQATWSSGDPTTAFVSNAPGDQGLARALKTGTTEISAQFGTAQASTQLEVTAAVLTKLLISPTTLTLPVGLGFPLKATGVFSDGSQNILTDQVTWTSQGPAVTVDADGRAVGAEEGSAAVQAELGTVQGSLNVAVQGTVTALKVVSGASASVRRAKVRFYALATLSDGSSRDASGDVQWAVQPATFGTIGQGANRPGELTAAASGPTSAQVVATLGSLQAQLATGNSTPNNQFLPLPRTMSLPLNGRRPVRLFGDRLTELTNVVWSSDNPAVANVTNGEVVALGAGNATLRPNFNGNIGFFRLKVHVPSSPLASLEVRAPGSSVPVGAFGAASAWAVTANGERLEVSDLSEWSSSAPETLLVTAGRVEGRQTGSGQVTAQFAGLSASATVSVAGTPSGGVFVDSSLPAGGDGSQARPYNNLAQAFDQLPSGAQLFAFAGERAGDGMQWLPNLPANLEFRGQGQGWDDRGIAAGGNPQAATLALNLRNNTLLQGFAGMAVGNIDFTTSANATMDNLNWGAGLVRFGTVQGACRVLNSEILSYSNTSGVQTFQVESTTATFPLAGSVEIGNITLIQNNATVGFLNVFVVGSGGLAPGFRLNVHDNTMQLDIPGFPLDRFGQIMVDALQSEISVTNNTGGTRARVSLRGSLSPSFVAVSGNVWEILDVSLQECGADVEILRNQLSGDLTLMEQSFSHPAGARLRVDDNQCARLSLETQASQVLVQRNRATSLLLTANTAETYARLFGVRDNVLTQNMTLNLFALASKCLALTGNQGVQLNLNGSADLIVEGLSMLSTLNNFTTIVLGNSFVDAPVDSCGIPY